eukprot:3628268-Pyramimonas_sp.AAC.1
MWCNLHGPPKRGGGQRGDDGLRRGEPSMDPPNGRQRGGNAPILDGSPKRTATRLKQCGDAAKPRRTPQ